MKKNKGFGESKNTLSISLITREEVTDEKLIEFIEADDLKWFGKITKNGITHQCALIPFNNSKTKKFILSVHLIFSVSGQIKLTQQEIDKLTKIAAKQIARKTGLLK